MMQTLVQQAVDSFAPVTLEELTSRASLSTRLDTKYVVNWAAFATVLETLHDEFCLLDIGGQRTFQYQSVYFDTDSLALYQAHVQGRRKRFKCRSRHYVDTGAHFFEIKMKGARSCTVKKQMAYDLANALLVTAEAWQFVRDSLIEQYGQQFDDELALALRNRYRRMTLVAREGAERLTCDFDLSFVDQDGRLARLASDFLVLETKSVNGKGLADRTLRAIGARSLPCSKYCVGMALLRPDVKGNDFRWLARRYFESDPNTAPSRRPELSTFRGRADLEISPSQEVSRRSSRRVSLSLGWRVVQVTTLLIANAACAFEVCKLSNPPLWLALVAGIGLAHVESNVVWRLLSTRPRTL